MAIKGKSKPRSRKVVTPGPRPTYVPVKRPLLARRGFQLGVLAVIVVGAAAGIWYGLAKERTHQRERQLAQRERTAATTFKGKVDGALVAVGQPAPSGFNAFPALTADVDGLAKGSVKPQTAIKDAKSTQQAAKTAASVMSQIDVASIAGGKGFDLGFTNYFFNAKGKMQEALNLYGTAAGLVREAAAVSGDQQKKLLESAKAIMATGSDLFNSGYSDYVNVQYMGHIYVPTPPTGTGS